jgi:hypothetical protein
MDLFLFFCFDNRWDLHGDDPGTWFTETYGLDPVTPSSLGVFTSRQTPELPVEICTVDDTIMKQCICTTFFFANDIYACHMYVSTPSDSFNPPPVYLSRMMENERF